MTMGYADPPSYTAKLERNWHWK